MNRRLVLSFVVAVFALAGHVCSAETHVKTSLIADVSAIHGGKPFTVGVLLEIDPGWHVYWSNPGDSGLATRVKFTLPDGYTATLDPFPVPRRFQQAANEMVFGYEQAVLITAKITPPVNAHVGDEVPIEAKVNWLVCKEECLPGKATVSLTLKVADHAGPANVADFERYQSIVTPIGQQSADVMEVKATIDKATHIATINVHWKSQASNIDLFPGANDALKVSELSIKKTEADVTPITLKIEPIAGQTAGGDTLLVLIAYKDAGGHTRGFEVGIPTK